MTLALAIRELERVRQREIDETPENDPIMAGQSALTIQALDMALSYLREREAFWQQQKELADRGGHTPGSDF